MRNSAFRFVLESAVRRALRSAEDRAVAVVVGWAVAALDVEEGLLALCSFETTCFAFGVPAVVLVVFVCRAWRLNEEAEDRVIDDALDFASSVADVRFSYFCLAPADFVDLSRGYRWDLSGDGSRCSCRWPCIWGR